MANSTQNGKRRGHSAAARNDVAPMTATGLAEPSDRTEALPSSAEAERAAARNGRAKPAGRAKPRPNGEGAPDPAPVHSAPPLIQPASHAAGSGKGSNGSAEAADPDRAPDDDAAPEPSDATPESAAPNFRAHLDEVSDTEISGWVMRADRPAHRCVVVLKERERVLARTNASRLRSDLVDAGIGDGCYSFSLPIPISLFDGRDHTLEIVEESTGFSLIPEPVRWRFGSAVDGDGDHSIPLTQDELGQSPSLDPLPQPPSLLDHEIELIRPYFDADYYAEEYPDIELGASELLTHYCTIGWREGRNPNPFFDTVSYILQNEDIARAETNPHVHYLEHGIREGRQPTPSASPSTRTMLALGTTCTDWVRLLRPKVDQKFYRSQVGTECPQTLDLVAHFAYRGWRERKSPSPDLDIDKLAETYPLAARLLVNPLLVHVKTLAGEIPPVTVPPEPETGEATRSIPPDVSATEHSDQKDNVTPAHGFDLSQIEVIRSEFSAAYYLTQYNDVASSGIDPLFHYCTEGWREGRNPNRSFHTRYYLRANEDVRIACVNPFWHYLVAGRAEGRTQSPPGGYRRSIIDSAREPARRTEHYATNSEPLLSSATVERRIALWARARDGFVVSLSHDCYVSVVGGTQIVISDEQKLFNANGYGYIHLSPLEPLLALSGRDPDFAVRVVLDGELIGITLLRLVPDILRKQTFRTTSRIFVIHCMLGFNVGQVCDLWSALEPTRSFYWIHDYSSVCEGFNLLRNDVAFCSAPPPASMACRVCVYGATRAAHLAQMYQLFQHCQFEVLAPSQVTYDLWQRVSDLPRQSVRAHPHWRLHPKPRHRNQKTSRRHDDKIAVAFVGFPSATKGWPIFCELVTALKGDERYRLHHFVANGAPSLPELHRVRTEVVAEDRHATIRLLRENNIHIVVMLSPWPETFSFVACEALVSGASVVCLRDSGNVAALVSETGQGMVFDSPESLFELFTSGAAIKICEDQHNEPIHALEPSGATASLALSMSVGAAA